MQKILQPVDVIAMHSADGEMVPIRFRVENECQERFRVDIDEIIRVTQIEYVGAEATIYQCRVRSEEGSEVVELKYRFRSHSWYLLK